MIRDGRIGSSLAAIVLGLVVYHGYQAWRGQPLFPEELDASRRYACTVHRVVDGDTLECREDRQRVRLLLIDAPEIKQAPLGARAAGYLAALVPAGSAVQLELDHETRDQYGRILAYAWLPDGRMLNEELVRAGFAIAFVRQPNVKYRDRIRRAQRRSKAGRAGLWAVGGFACPPVAFRHGRCR